MPTDTQISHQETENCIALIGMSCKFPGATDPNTLWQNILSKHESISFFNVEELTAVGVKPELIQNSSYVAARGIFEDIDKFDATFFGYSPYEASITDPQHRIFLEQAWIALENAGYIAEQFHGPIGLFAGMSDSTYLTQNLLNNKKQLAKWDQQQIMLASSPHYLCTKVAYVLGLTGPCVNVSTACSTGLVSIIMACESLVSYDCDMALAGAITITVPEKSGYLYQEAGILSPDGHCRAFDKEAQGTVMSNGCGIVVLKRLADALQAHDNIIAVIKGWSINNDGADKAGFTAPSVNGQATCVSQAIAYADIKPIEIEYLEAHGTGTVLGDPIEITALTKGYEYNTYKKSQYCAIGSIKPNIGHTDVAAGVAGFIKAALALREKILPPTLHYTTANEKINFVDSPFYVSNTARPWKTQVDKRTAAVNSLGFGGTNAHLVMQEAPLVHSSNTKSANVLIFSAKTYNSLEAVTVNLANYIENIPNDHEANKVLANTAYTLQVGRKDFKWRRAIAYSDITQLKKIITDTNFLKKHTHECLDKVDSRIIFGFPGQGTQYANMSLEIYEQNPFFKKIVDNCCEQIINLINVDLREFLYPTKHTIEHANEMLRNTQYAQLALFTVEYGLAKLLINFGIKPNAMIGHSIGEYVAATLSEVISEQDAIILIAKRAELMAKTQEGSMLAVPMAKKTLTPFLSPDLALAAHNAPELCVVSGAKEKIEVFKNSLQPLLDENNLECIHLHTSHAFHSLLMEEILIDFKQITQNTSLKPAQIPYISNLTGDWITQTDLKNEDYWANHLRNTVLFSEGIDNLKLSPKDIFIEIGPGQTLSQLVKQHIKNTEPLPTINTLPHAKEYLINNVNSYEYFLESLGKSWLYNKKIDWKNLYTGESRKRIPLPTYYFERQRHWVEPDQIEKITSAHITFDKQRCYSPTWERDLRLSSLQNNASQQTLKKHWLIFTNKDMFCDALITHLKSENHSVYIVFCGNDFSHSDDSFTISPDNKAHYLKLLETIKFSGENITLIHTWLLNNKKSTNNLTHSLSRGAYSLLYFSQVFSEIYHDKKLVVLALANNICKVLGDETIYPEKATIVGPCKVLPQEQENISCKFIDIDLKNTPIPQIIDGIYWESINNSSKELPVEIAYRGDYRWIKHFNPCSEHIKTNQKERLKNQGVYLITGGLGGIGLEIAKYLSKNFQAHLILTTRKTFFNKDGNLISDTTDATELKKLAALQEIKANASSLTIKQTAVEDETKMREVALFIREKFGKIDGIIHAAGIAGGGAAQLKTIEEYNKVLKPKLDGTKNLVSLFKDQHLDFIAFFSSITAVTGFPGQIDYCSANLVLDSYVSADHFNSSTFCTVINWEAWREIGMAAESKTKLMDLTNENSISPETGVRLFKEIISSNLNQVVISGTPPDTLLSGNNKQNTLQLKSDLTQSKKPTGDLDNVTKILTQLWQEILGVQDVTIDDDFYELGGHSLLAISLLSKMNRVFGFKMPPSILLKAKTIRELTHIIASNEQEKEISPIVTLQEGGDKPPLFILHPVGGTAFCYLLLAQHLKKDRTIYGLQDPSIAKEKPLFSTLEEMANSYLQAIQKIQPKGPYYLCGASFGATLAVEIAYQLLKQKERVNFVGLLDGWAAFSSTQYDKNYAKSIISLHQQDENSRVLPKNIDNLKLWEDLLQYRLNIMAEHSLKKIATKLTLFKPTEILLEYQEIQANDNHWSTYSTLPVEIHLISGDHNSMLQNPHVFTLAKQVQTCIDMSNT